MSLDNKRYVISDSPTDSTTGLTTGNLAFHVDCIQPCRTIIIKNFHLKLEDLILEKFYLHVELPLIDDDENDLLPIPYNKYVSVEYNI